MLIFRETINFIIMKKVFLLAALLLIPLFSWSQFYVGGSVGNSFINTDLDDISGDSFKFDGNSFGWKVFAGTGIKFMGIEGSYRSLGKIKTNSGGEAYSVVNSGGDIALKGNINLGPVVAFAKGGVFFSTEKIKNLDLKTNSTNFLWGLGAGLNLGGLGVRLEYESLGKGLSMLTLGAAIQL